VNRNSDDIKPHFSKRALYNALSEVMRDVDENNLIKPTARSNIANLELKFNKEDFDQVVDYRKR